MELYRKCETCGKIFAKKSGSHAVDCPECREKSKKEHEYVIGLTDVTPRKKYKRNEDIKIIAAMAKSMGITYGKLEPRIASGEIKMWTRAEWNAWRKENVKEPKR